MNANEPPQQPGAADAGGSIPADELKKAYQAFKKRLKLARLEDESRLGHRALTKGGQSNIVGIQPPNQFPQPVWDELVRQGKLKYAGHGLYSLGGPPDRH